MEQEGIRNLLKEKSAGTSEEIRLLLQFEEILKERGRSGKTPQWSKLEDSALRYSGNRYSGDPDYYRAVHVRVSPNELMEGFHQVSAGEYTIKILCDKFQIFGVDRIPALTEAIESGRITGKQPQLPKKQWDPAERLLQELTEELRRYFLESGISEKDCRKSAVRKMIVNLSEKDFLNLFIPGLGALFDQEDVNNFFLRVYGRPGLDCSVPGEFLLYLSMESLYHEHSVYHTCSQLKLYYEKLRKKQEAEEKTPWQGEDFFVLSDRLLEEMNGQRLPLFQGETCTEESVHPSVKKLFLQHIRYGAKDYDAVRKAYFDRMMKEVMRLYADDIAGFRLQHEMLKSGRTWDEIDGPLYVSGNLEIRGTHPETIRRPVEDTPGYVGKCGRRDRQIWKLEDKIKGARVISAATDITYSGKKGTEGYACGKVRIECLYGSQIPRGTIVTYCGEGGTFRYEYETVKDYESVPRTNFYEYLYGAPSDIAQIREDKEEMSLYSIDPELYRDWLEPTELNDRAERYFDDRSAEQKRAYLLTLFFLKFAKQKKNISSKQEMRERFAREADVMLKECGLAAVFRGNRYDLFLEYLLGNTEPVRAFQEIWLHYKCAAKHRDGKNEPKR